MGIWNRDLEIESNSEYSIYLDRIIKKAQRKSM